MLIMSVIQLAVANTSQRLEPSSGSSVVLTVAVVGYGTVVLMLIFAALMEALLQIVRRFLLERRQAAHRGAVALLQAVILRAHL